MEKPIEVGCTAIVVGGHPGNLGASVLVIRRSDPRYHPECQWVITRCDGEKLYAYGVFNEVSLEQAATADSPSLLRIDDDTDVQEEEEEPIEETDSSPLVSAPRKDHIGIL